MVNIGIIGAGFWGEKHAEAIKQIPNANLVAANRSTPNALEAFTQKYQCKGYTDYRDLLADGDIDAVVIATPHHLHTEITLAAAKAGKHILLEKPIAPNLEEVDQILQAAKDNKVVFMAGHTNHFVPIYKKVKDILHGGELGSPVMIIDRTLKKWWSSNRREWHLNREKGGGMWLTIAVHNIDRMVWLMESQVKSVCASIGTRFHDQPADDHGVALLRFENGNTGLVVVVGYETGVASFDTEIVCTQGIMRIDKMGGLSTARNEVWQHYPNEREINPDNWMDDAMVDEWSAFLKAVELGVEPEVTGEFARHIMQVIFSAEKSANEHKEVEIPRG